MSVFGDGGDGGGAEQAAEPWLLASGRRLGGRYVLERPLGRGGMAAVWLANDLRLDRPVAVKVLSDTFAGEEGYLKRFAREARTAAGLQHPNLVAIYDFSASERPYLVMEYIEGGDLAERIDAGQLPDPERLAAELLSALRHIHAASVLHRDIKPQNVLIDANGHARLTDFGIAQPADATTLTRAGHVMGTERYIAPEVLCGEPASERSDLFALGVVLAAACVGAGGELSELIDRLRDDDPGRRPRSAAAALAVLERAKPEAVTGKTAPLAPVPAVVTEPTEPQAVAAPPTPLRTRAPAPLPSATPSSHGRRNLIAVLALAALAVAIVAVVALSSGDDPGGGGGGAGEGQAESGKGEETAGGGGAGAQEAPTEAEPVDEVPAEEPVDGATLNDQGKALLDGGDPEAAVPVLQQAVAELEGSGDELTYNFALYNLGDALVQAGRPDEAIPILEQRLAYPNQTETVQATLDEAYAAAGIQPESSGEKPEKPDKGPPKTPPGQED